MGTGITFFGPNPTNITVLEQLELADGVISLTGSPIVGVRWTTNKKQDLIAE